MTDLEHIQHQLNVNFPAYVANHQWRSVVAGTGRDRSGRPLRGFSPTA